MPKEATFDVIGEFEGDGTLELECEQCGTEALVPTKGRGVRIEATKGMGYFYDPATPPPPGFMPEVIRCRRCHWEYSNVR